MCIPSNIERFNNASERDSLKCGICYGTITREDYKKLNIWTHVGGENHDPMHKSCLKEWALSRINSGNQPRCPFDFCVLDVSSLTSRAERVFQNLKPCLVDGAFAAVTGLMAGAALGVGEAAVAAAVGVVEQGVGVEAAIVAGVGGVGGVVTGFVVKSLFNRMVGLGENGASVMMGLYIGGLTSLFFTPLNLLSGYPTTLLTISLVSGVAVGCITAYRRFVAH
jgi:hypothetical protein